MKEGFKFANKLFREKLIDQEEFTQGPEVGTEKSNGGRYAVFAHTNAYGWINDVINAQLEKSVKDKMIMLETPLAAGVEKAQMTYTGLKGWNVVAITKNCKTPERAMQLMNLLSSEKGQIMSRIGPEGTVWNMEDGKVKLTPKYKEMVQNDRDGFNKEVGFDIWNYLGNKKYDYAFNAIDSDASAAEKERMAKICSNESWYIPGVDSVVIDPKSKEGLAATKITDYFNLQQKKLIMTQSDAEFEAKYSEMQANIDKLGVKALEAEVTKQIQAEVQATK
jgi:putative aldouronate transport system substrate-binding protein